MTLQILQVLGAGQGPALAAPSPAGPTSNGFSLDLARAAARPETAAQAHPPAPAVASPQASPLLPAMGAGHPATVDPGLPEGAADALAEIAERLALIQAIDEVPIAPGARPTPPDAGPTEPGRVPGDDAGETLAPAPTANLSEPETAPLAPANVMAVLPQPTEVAGRPGQEGPERPTAAAPLATPLADREAGVPARPQLTGTAAANGPDTALRAAALPATEAQALPTRRDAVPATAEIRTEGLAATTTSGGQASPLPVATPGPAGQPALTAPLNSPAWPRQLEQQLVVMGQRGGEQRVELHLHPAELGPLSVSLKVGEQSAQAQFLSAQAPVRQAVELALPQLREALAEQGITLGEASVGEQRHQEGDSRQPARGTGVGGQGDVPEEPESAMPALSTAGGITLPGRVDLYA